ncbi:DUF535 family protein [Limnohabitans sp. JirII-31]|uniref:DUF535 family protein n=1 Tax=Limnohabitans sp. JirII-31 TaxID=1977908 RepID=UPI0013043DC2|nr:DUF535 family protein [Limnohabitans sp. JirII-31]
MLPTPQSLFQRTDDAAGGSLQTFKRWLKFRLRFFWHRRHIFAVHDHLRQLGLASVLESDLLLVVRCTRAYLWSGLTAQGRAAAQMAHFDWLVQTFSSTQASALYALHSWLLCEWTLKDRQVRIVLRPGRALAREGELELHLELDGSPVMRAAFSVLPAHMVGGTSSGAVLVVGNVQGSQEGKDLVKDFTQLMERTRPSGILLNALQGLAQGWGLEGLLGVSDVGHAYADYRSLSQRVGMSYDTLWQELGAEQRLSDMHWSLPLVWLPRPESEVASSKRSQLRRRNDMRQQVLGACLAAAQTRRP